MSLFKRIHTVKVPAEFLDKGDPITTLQFSQLNPKKMDKANLAHILAAFNRQDEMEAGLNEKQRAAWDERLAQPSQPPDKESTKSPQEPDTFDSFDDHKLIELAHVNYKVGSKWVEFTNEQIDDLLCMEWLAGKIYDVSKPISAKAREKNS